MAQNDREIFKFVLDFGKTNWIMNKYKIQNQKT
jgi:hypothetical protein